MPLATAGAGVTGVLVVGAVAAQTGATEMAARMADEEVVGGEDGRPRKRMAVRIGDRGRLVGGGERGREAEGREPDLGIS